MSNAECVLLILILALRGACPNKVSLISDELPVAVEPNHNREFSGPFTLCGYAIPRARQFTYEFPKKKGTQWLFFHNISFSTIISISTIN